MVDRITGPIEIVNATLSGAQTYLPSGVVTNTAFSSSAAARLDATKADHQRVITWTTDTDSTTIANIERIVHVAQGAGTIIAAYVRNETAPAGGDLDYTVEILRDVNGGGSFATILSSAIASPADNTVGSGTLASTTFAQYDTFMIDINTSGSTGVNGIGVTVVLVLNEAPA